ncbi:hypothetical protein JXQ70_02070 [bacterium]|nr:hypothetical protein [bacterium]
MSRYNYPLHKIVLGRRCPGCDRQKCRRIARESWMHVIPFIKHYSCRRCGFTYITFLGSITILLKKDPKLSRKHDFDFESEGAETLAISSNTDDNVQLNT